MADTDKTYEILNYYGLKTNIEDAKKWIKQYVTDALSKIKTDLMTNVTYNELVSLRDNNNLKPGMLYRMTDYVTKVYSEDESVSSAEHPFDLILFANTTNSLNENAFACLNGNSDGYFDESNINVWEIKYSLNNNTNRFEFTDTENGKGVIYYMKDEFNNEAPFDFKNILQNDGEYTFGNNGEDYSLNGYVNGIYNNKILPCVNSETGKQTINKIRVAGKDCHTNLFKPTCVNSYINFPISECDISMNNDGELVVFKTTDFISGIENKPIEHNYKNDYLTFEALEDGEIGWWTHPDSDVNVHIFWSKDKENWTEFTQNDSTANYIFVSNGENLYCRGINLDGVSGQYALDNDACNGFAQNSGKWNIKGNVMSLIDYNNMTTMTEMVGNFYYLFSDNDGFKNGNTIDIVNAIDFVLPATTLAQSCYSYMFQGCTSLTTAPALPATTLADWCYQNMFRGCTSLTTAPELPATTLADSCYNGMFLNCTSLTTAPVLPATTLADGCYYDMFQGCTSLTTAPELPATTLATYCYYYMFYGCSSLTTAPELPATTLASYCYSGMFWGCTSLMTAPELPAITLVNGCYSYMFQGCTNLNYIKCLAVNGINQNRSTSNWVSGVASTGTFVKHPDATSWTTGNNGIPTNWTAEYAVIE